MTSIMNLLQRYSGATPETAPSSVHGDFEQVAQGAQRDHLASGLNQAFRSDQTPPFENMLGSLFGASNGEQKAGILNQLLGAVGPGVLSSGILGGILGSGGPSGAAGPASVVTPQQAEQISPEAVQQLAKNAQQQDPTIVDRASSFYAQHPTLVHALGAGALALVMSHMSQNRS